MNKIDNFIEFFNNKLISYIDSFDGKKLRFKKSNIENSEIDKIIKDIFSEIEIHLNQEIEINIRKVKISNIYFFYKTKDFISNYHFNDEFENDQIIIINDKKVYQKLNNDEFNNHNSIIYNIYYYQKIFNELKTNYYFSSYYDSSREEIILNSKSTDILKIGYDKLYKNFKRNENLENSYKSLFNEFEKKEFIKLFINNISESNIDKELIKDRYKYLLKYLDFFINRTQKDYKNYILEFSFEKIKSKFKEERNKYFESLEKNIEIINKQTLSIPLTFGATIFASYQSSKNIFIIILIAFVYSLYNVIAFKTINLAKYNIKCLKKDFKKEKLELKNKYDNYDEFKKDFKKIEKKTHFADSLVLTIEIILVILIIVFYFYSVFLIFSNNFK
ncbi:hypothetical protein [Empedobacter brevis]|uniref:hypothetical protein n=1 Tax=Empedobacter brevis TaxID=247 RepID=UPI0028D609B9|nr:hypothetical protein [Empedobacter brevis]